MQHVNRLYDIANGRNAGMVIVAMTIPEHKGSMLATANYVINKIIEMKYVLFKNDGGIVFNKDIKPNRVHMPHTFVSGSLLFSPLTYCPVLSIIYPPNMTPKNGPIPAINR